jgi:hypothetical protein
LGPIPNPQSPIPNPQSPFNIDIEDYLFSKLQIIQKLINIYIIFFKILFSSRYLI